MTIVLGCWDCESEEKAVALLTRNVFDSRYTENELAFAVSELRRCPELDKKMQFPGGRVTAADFYRVVMKRKRFRALAQAELRHFDVLKMINDYPDMVSWSDFGLRGKTAAGDQIYMLKDPVQLVDNQAITDGKGPKDEDMQLLQD